MARSGAGGDRHPGLLLHEDAPEPLPDLDQQLWTETRRSAVRDVQAATGWLARADVGAGDVRLTHRLAQMGWQGEVADQPAWTAMEQSARAILKCQALAELT